jgi:hypothetical protein
MGLRCLLGHDFGPPEIEREREENGDEMVVTVREIETCRRCGDERVVSENKEVTAIRSPDDVGMGATPETADSEPDADATPTAESSASDAESPSTDRPDDADTPATGHQPEGADDGVILDDGSERAHGEWPDSDVSDSDSSTASESADRVDAAAEAIAAASTDADEDDDQSAADVTEHTDDEGVELLDDEATDATPAGGESPAEEPGERGVATERGSAAEHGGAAEQNASAAPSSGESGAWPDHGGSDEGFDAGQATGGAPSDVSFGGGLTPGVGDQTEQTGDRERGEYVGVEGADEDDEFEDIVRVDSDADGGVTEFFCPNCGLSERAGETSMRVGDICPSCHKGYVAERNA